MDASKDLLIDQSIDGSPIKTSTVAKANIRWSEEAFFKRHPYNLESDSLFAIDTQSPVAVLNEVTNIRKDSGSIPVFKLNSSASLVSDGANSSLGILHVENFSDFNDSASGSQRSSKVSNSENQQQFEKISKFKDSKSQQDMFYKVTETSSGCFDKPGAENGASTSSSDIEYDGTNIPELNLDFDVASLLNFGFEKKDFSPRIGAQSKSKAVADASSSDFYNNLTASEGTTSHSCTARSNLVHSDVSGDQSSFSVRHSVFKDHETSLDSLYQQLKSKQDQSVKFDKSLTKIKVCPFLDVSSFEIEPMLRKESNKNLPEIEKARGSESMSVDFCPEMISARSSSFKSSLAPQGTFSGTAGQSKLQISQHSNLQPFLEDLENEVLSGSGFYSPHSKHASQAPFQNISQGDGQTTFMLGDEKDSQFQENVANGSAPEFALEGENWCSRLGLSESDFFNSDAAKELFKKDFEEFKETTLLSTNSSKADASSWSPPSQMEVTAPSWVSASEVGDSRHISLGTLIKAKSGQLGTLSSDVNRERPYFGMSANSPTKLQNQTAASQNHFETFRPSALSEILDSISFADPLQCAVKNAEAFASACQQYSSAGAPFPEVLKEEEHPVKLPKEPPSQSVDVTDAKPAPLNESELATKESESHPEQRPSDVSCDKLEEPEKNERSDSSFNVSSVGSTCESVSVKTAKLGPCSSCSMASSEQNAAQGYCRSASACSSSCFKAVSVPNQCNLQHPCLRHSSVVHDSGQCLLPGNCVIMSNSNPGFVTHLCSQLVLQPGQVCAPNVLSGTPFALGVNSDSSQVCIETPSRLCFPEKIAVGDLQEVNLPIQNAANIACSYQISCPSAYLNSLPIVLEMCGLNFVKSVPCSSGGSTDVKLILAPKYEGKYEIDLQVDAVPSPAGMNFSSSPGLTSRTKVEFEAIQPSVSLKRRSQGQSNTCVIAGSSVVEYVTVTNNCEVSVPLRISLSSDSEHNQVYFGLKDIDHLNKTSASRPTFLSPKIMLYRLPGTKDASYPSHLDIPMVFESMKSQVTATLTAAIETTTLSIELAFISVTVSVGYAKLVLKDPSQNPLRLRTSEASTCNHSLTVVNEGTMSVAYDLLIESESSCFSVSPDTLNLEPKQSATVSVTFAPLAPQSVQGILRAAIQHYGQVFNIVEIFGEVKSGFRRLPFPKDSRNLGSYPTNDSFQAAYDSSNLLETNKRFLFWGGTDVGKAVLKSFSIRNSKKVPVEARLFMKDKSTVFQIIDDSGSKTSSTSLTMKPKEEREISVAFTPDKVNSYSSVLFMKSWIGRDSMTHSLPLSGYGGASKIAVLGLPDGEGLTVDLSSKAEIVYKNVLLQNVGLRAAFVKIFVSYGTIVQHPVEKPTVIHPSEFVLLENERKNILISINCLNKNFASSDEIVTILFGDEILRQRLRKKKNISASSNDQGHNMYNIDFTVPYDGENKVPQDTSVFSTRNDALFYTSIKKLMVPIFFDSQNASFSSHDFTVLSVVQDSLANLSILSTPSSSRRLTIEGHSPPVKESAIRNINRLSLPIPFEDKFSGTCPVSPVSSLVDGISCLKLDSWTLSPENLVLDSETKDKRIVLKSYSNSDLRFKVECTVDVIAVSPVSGTIASNGEIGLRLSLISNNHIRLLDDYQGSIKVLCDGTEKIVNIKVLKDERKMKRLLHQRDLSNHLHQPLQSSINLSVRSGFLSDSIVDNTVLASPVQNVLLVSNIYAFPKHIDLPYSTVGSKTELKLNIDNPSDKTITWNIHPISVLFTEPFDDSIDCSRPAIEFPSSNGIIKVKESITVLVKFLPTSVAQFSQFFELTLIDENGKKENCSFKVQGDGLTSHLPDFPNQSNDVKNKKLSLNSRKKAKSDVFLEKEVCEFRPVSPGQRGTAEVKITNATSQECKFTVIKPTPPFSLRYSSVTVKPQRFLKIPVAFKPVKAASTYEGEIIFLSENGIELKVKLKGCSS